MFKDNYRRLKVFGYFLLAIFFLAGCGGGSSGDFIGDDDSGFVTGTVADGYIQGAIVCLDRNQNMQCDPYEPTATTDEQGRFTLEGEDLYRYPILAVIPPAAIDMDNPGVAIGKEFILSAPAGRPEFVSPLTTLVRKKVDETGLTPASAAELVAAELNIDDAEDVFSDYIARKTKEADEDIREKYESIHRYAQLIADAYIALHSQILEAIDTANLGQTTEMTTIANLIADKVLAELATIRQQVENNRELPPAQFQQQRQAISGVITAEIGTIDAENIAQELESVTSTQRVSFQEMLQNGRAIYWMDYDTWGSEFWMEYGRLSLAAGGKVLVEEFEFDPDTGEWEYWPPYAYDSWFLVGGQWRQDTDAQDTFPISFQTDGTAIISIPAEGSSATISATAVDLAGKRHADYVGNIKTLFKDPDARFNDGAKAYRLTFTNNQNIYEIYGDDDYWTNQVPYAPTLDALLSNYGRGEMNNFMGISMDYSIQFGENGVVDIYRGQFNTQRSFFGTGSWTRQTLGGRSAIIVRLPTSLLSSDDISGHPLYVQWPGDVVKQGEFIPAGQVEPFQGWDFNDAAFTALLENLDISRDAMPEEPANPNATIQIDGGGSHSVLLKADGTVWTWGSGGLGRLGDGTYNSRMLPAKIDLPQAKAISSGSYQAFALLTDGTVMGWGRNSSGALGDGTTVDRSFPVHVAGLQNVIQVSGGADSTAALTSDGRVWTWGHDYYEDRLLPVLVEGIDNVKAISHKGSHTVALKYDGTVWGWGNGVYGQLGNGITASFQQPAPFIGLEDIIQIGTGFGTTFALRHDGTVWACGYNLFGEIGDGTTDFRSQAVQVAGLTDVVKIAAGTWHTLALKADGKVWAWGETAYLGHGSDEPTLVPVPVVGLENVKYISAGNGTNYAITNDGKVWAWGWNGAGKLGDGTWSDIPIPTIIDNL